MTKSKNTNEKVSAPETRIVIDTGDKPYVVKQGDREIKRFARVDHAQQFMSAPSEAVREIVCAGWDGRSEPIYRYRDELDLPEWQQVRVFPPQNMLPVKNVNVGGR